jgi:hypothetical protein
VLESGKKRKRFVEVKRKRKGRRRAREGEVWKGRDQVDGEEECQ